MQAITHRNVLDEVIAFEGASVVENYCVNGVNVWPYLRTSTAWRKLNERRSASWRIEVGECARRLARYSRFFLCDRRKSQAAEKTRAAVAFVTQANRRESVNGRYWHTLADPLVTAFKQRGVESLVCEAGQARWPRAMASYWISKRFKAMRVLKRYGPRLAEPEWFDGYAQWARETLQGPVTWHDWETRLRELFARARVYRRIFRAAGVRCVFVDCWYNDNSLPATLAAKQLGVKTVELQHGLLGPHLFGYTGWRSISAGRYELIPDLFWVWGERDAAILQDHNGYAMKAEVGGNAWLNSWRAPTRNGDFELEISRARRLRKQSDVAVLVTTQPDVQLAPVMDAIGRSPESWCWLLRVHRKTRQSICFHELRRRLSGIRGNVKIEEPSSLPLHALLPAVDVHVTGYSTCGIEALAHGVPTVVFHPTGKAAFQQHIRCGGMRYCEEGSAILQDIRTLAAETPADCSSLVERDFATAESTSRAIDRVMERL